MSNERFWLISGLLAAGFFAVAIFAPEKTPQQLAQDRADAAEARKSKIAEACADEDMFFVIAQKFVLQDLKAPATADFPSRAASTTKTADCRYIISGYVDAENSFGANIRSSWAADVEYIPGGDNYVAHQVRVQ